MTTRILTALCTALLAAEVGSAAEPALTRYTFAEPHMGTRFQILLYAPDEATANRAARAAFARIAELDGIMSDYRPTSELMLLCKQAGGEPVKVSDDLHDILTRSQQLFKRSDGAFDITIAPVGKLWRRARKIFELPDAADLAKARALVGMDNVVLGEKTVRLKKEGMLLDLGGIAKGYAADAAQKVLKQHGVSQALVAAGGDIVVSDPPPNADGWKVAIAPLEPVDDDTKGRTLLLKNAAVSTSGDTEQYVEIDGKRYSHILDPRTGVPLTERMSVTVIAANGTTSDSLATAVSVLGPDKGLKLVEDTPGVAALFVRKTERGLESIPSKRFPVGN